MSTNVLGASSAVPRPPRKSSSQQPPVVSSPYTWEGILKPPGLLPTSTDTQKCSTRCYKHGNVLCSTRSDYYWYLPLAQVKSVINHPLPYQLQAEIATKITEVSRRVYGAQWSPLCLSHNIFNFFCCHNSWKSLASTTYLIYLHHKLTTVKCNLFLKSQHNELSP